MPGDPEKVEGIYIPEAYVLKCFLYLVGDEGRILHLGKGGQNYLVLTGYLNIVLKLFIVLFKIYHGLLLL